LLGGVFGSFLNAMAFRHAHRSSRRETKAPYDPDHERSNCPSCGHQLSWFENIPAISWIVQKGACRSCRATIPVVYVIAEIGMAMAFLTIWWVVQSHMIFILLAAFLCLIVFLLLREFYR
jgi:prepilin signal peptidase PulO-like enzyme (type II secretory pathway)